MLYCKDVAAHAGVSPSYVSWLLTLADCDRVGKAARAIDAADWDRRSSHSRLSIDVPLVRDFRGWTDAFGRFKLVAEAYLNLSRIRGDKYAASFLSDIREICERAQERASK